MIKEYYNRQRRRQRPLAEQILDQERRKRIRAKFIRYVPNPMRPQDTVRLVHEELHVIEYIRGARQVWVKMWPTLNELAGLGPERDKRPRRQAILALVTRMIAEKKLVRHRRSNSLALAEWLRSPPTSQSI